MSKAATKEQLTKTAQRAAAADAEVAQAALAAVQELDAAKADVGHTHTAASVGAAATGHTHTAADVGAAASGHTHTAASVGALPSTGGTLTGALSVQGAITATGNVAGNYMSGTWLRTSAAAAQTTATKIAVIDGDGWIYWISPANLRTAIDAQQRPLSGTITIPTTGWVNDTTVPGCSKRLDLAIAGVTASDQAEIRIKPASRQAAEVLSTTNETIAGAVRIWAAAVPSAAIEAEYWIERS